MKKKAIEPTVENPGDRIYDDTDNPYGDNDYEMIDYENIDDLQEIYCNFHVYTQILPDNESNVCDEVVCI